MDVLDKARANGGQKEEASLVNINGYVVESVTGPDPTIKDNVQSPNKVLPSVFPNEKTTDVQATIHSHTIKPLVDGDVDYSQSAEASRQ
ncbi:hypothetical protein GA0116948_1294 [Chitinophaga costaii]|uniref:Uncharacterized protein n=1 Tax=Chitinophaga costaii TaxID=1335309 RepID=A0A1C4G7X4_9BACT|nr:hypothetical protein [Chitinophaga costaii]PUZ19331.1 hypothetical protein DCM91_20675 [Chitinophaga costaii]SCC64297.1 hypothetical protein GA0116948_1294 [Chitinophaga costaii]